MIGRARTEASPGTPDLLNGPFPESHCEASGRCETAGHADGGLTESRIDWWRMRGTGWSPRLWWWRCR